MAQASEEKIYLDEDGLARVLGKNKTYIDIQKAKNNPCVRNVQFSTDEDTNAVEITWVDPINDDWDATMIRKKFGGPPLSATDGDLIGISTIRNAHIAVPFVDDSGSDDGSAKLAYYRFFTRSKGGIYSDNSDCFEYENTVSIVSFSEGSDKAIANMLNAHHSGIINVREYWSIGDERIDGSGNHLLIVDDNDTYELTKSDRASERTYGAFVVLIKQPMIEVERGVDQVDYTGAVNITGTIRSSVNNKYNGYTFYYTWGGANDILFRDSGEIISPDALSIFRNVRVPDNTTTRSFSYSPGGNYPYADDSKATIVGNCSMETNHAEQNVVKNIAAVSLKNVGITDQNDSLSSDVTFEYFDTPSNLSSIIDGVIGTRSMKKSFSIGSFYVYVTANKKSGSFRGSTSTPTTYEASTISNDILCVDDTGTVTQSNGNEEQTYLFFGVV